MAQVFDIDSVPADSRLLAWQQGASRLIHPMVVRAEPAGLHGRVTTSDALGLRTIRVCGVPSTVERPALLISPQDPAFVLLTMVVTGSVELEQGAGAGRLEAGDLTWYLASRPYRLQALTPFDLVHFLVPAVHAPLLRERLGAGSATPVPRGTAVSSVLPPFLAAVVDWQLAEDGGARDGALGASLVQLIASLGGTPGRGPAGTAADDHVEAATRYVQEHLGDRALTPATIAAACHVSLRQLHRAFARRGTSVAASVMSARLAGAALRLADPDRTAEPIAATARAFGFTSPAHFSRRFAAEFGRPPAEWRRSAPPVGASNPACDRPR